MLCACASSKIQIFRHACYLKDTRSLRRRSELRFDAVSCDLIMQRSNLLEILCELKGFFTKAQQKVGCSSCLSIKAKNPNCYHSLSESRCISREWVFVCFVSSCVFCKPLLSPLNIILELVLLFLFLSVVTQNFVVLRDSNHGLCD